MTAEVMGKDETPADTNVEATADIEAGIRNFVRQDFEHHRLPMSASAEETAQHAGEQGNSEAIVAHGKSLIERLAGTSVKDIESLITELESRRDLLQAEGQRVQREISGYAKLNQAAMKYTRMIADNIAQWKGTADDLRNS
jgi:hypothetical protein